jgi:hypothetical protein
MGGGGDTVRCVLERRCQGRLQPLGIQAQPMGGGRGRSVLRARTAVPRSTPAIEHADSVAPV